MVEAHNATNSVDNPFWLYSIERYQKTGCADFLLHAQDNYNLDVNILLFIGWLNQQGAVYIESASLQLVHQWQVDKVQPIRRLRQRVKALHDIALYNALKEMELTAEKSQQQMLFTISRSWPVSNKMGFEEFSRSFDNYWAGKVAVEKSWLQALYQHLQP